MEEASEQNMMPAKDWGGGGADLHFGTPEGLRDELTIEGGSEKGQAMLGLTESLSRHQLGQSNPFPLFLICLQSNSCLRPALLLKKMNAYSGSFALAPQNKAFSVPA